MSTFFNAKTLADFEGTMSNTDEMPEKSPDVKNEEQPTKQLKIGLNYTINLVLPKTDDPSIYNAIFKSLKESLLRD